MPRPQITSQWNRAQGSRSSRAGTFVSTVLAAVIVADKLLPRRLLGRVSPGLEPLARACPGSGTSRSCARRSAAPNRCARTHSCCGRRTPWCRTHRPRPGWPDERRTRWCSSARPPIRWRRSAPAGAAPVPLNALVFHPRCTVGDRCTLGCAGGIRGGVRIALRQRRRRKCREAQDGKQRAHSPPSRHPRESGDPAGNRDALAIPGSRSRHRSHHSLPTNHRPSPSQVK